VKGVRNKFVGCESQDTRSHGWYIEWGMNVYTACSADSAGATGAGGTPNSADGFYLVTADHTSLTGCQSFDRYGGAAQQRYGFNVPRALVEGGRLIAPTGWGNARDLVLAR
jgi:hypothetical protein